MGNPLPFLPVHNFKLCVKKGRNHPHKHLTWCEQIICVCHSDKLNNVIHYLWFQGDSHWYLPENYTLWQSRFGIWSSLTFVGLRPCLVSYVFSQDLRPFFKINSRSCLFKDSSFHRLAVVGAVALRFRDTAIQFSSYMIIIYYEEWLERPVDLSI